jgi:AcrR family transcriptional regulator
VDEIAEAAGFSKGAVYWHFTGKDELFLALLEERIDRPVEEAIGVMESASPEEDMSLEANRVFAELFGHQRELVLLDQEYWARAARDPEFRERYVKQRAELRRALAEGLETRVAHLGAPPFDTPAEETATAFLALARGLAFERLLEPDAVPDHLLGEMFALVYAGLVARAQTREAGGS